MFIEEVLTNEAAVDFSYMWGHHIAFGLPFLQNGSLITTNAQHFEAEPLMPKKEGFRREKVFLAFRSRFGRKFIRRKSGSSSQ